MEVTLEPNRLSMASRILLGGLLLINLILLIYLLSAEPAVEAGNRKVAVYGSDQKLVLISELSDEDRADMIRSHDEEARTLTGLALEVPESAVVCRAWGPFPNMETLAAVRALVEEVDPGVEIRAAEIEAAPDYLVYLESDDNLDNARRLLQELESQNIEAYVIAGGEYVNSVSAGVFSNRAGAEEVRARLADLGFAPRLQALERVQQVNYLLGQVPTEFEVADAVARSCEEIAPPT